MTNKMIPLPLLAGLIATPALAQDEAAALYASASSLNWEIENGNVGKGSGLRLIYGASLSDYLAIELHGGLGGGSTVSGVEVELKELLGGYLRAQYPMNEMVSVFARYGYTRAKFDVDDGITESTESETGGSYGAGIEFTVFSRVLDGNLRLTADYMLHLDKTGAAFDARSVGVKLQF